MKPLSAAEIPADHPYYRSSSPAYREYLRGCGLSVVDAPGGYGWIKQLPFGLSLAKFERLPGVPDVSALKAAGFRRGWVIWVPARAREIPSGWRKMWVRTHLVRTGFSEISGPDYAAGWSQRARRALKRFLSVPGAKVVSMPHADFAAAFRAARVRHAFKSSYLEYFRKISALAPDAVRSWGAEYGGKVVAGLAALDYAGSSTAHLVAFTCPEAKEIQAGTALVDRWFSDSLARGLRYVDFDHLHGPGMTPDQKGYSRFKENFIGTFAEYRDSYFRWIG